MKRLTGVLVWGIVLLALASCIPKPEVKEESPSMPQAQPAAIVPLETRWQAGVPGLAGLNSGLESFRDQRLESLATEALRHNRTLKQSADNFSRSLRSSSSAVALYAPVLTMNPLEDGRKPRGLTGFSTISWETGLWKRLNDAKGNGNVTDGELDAARQSLVMQLARSWFVALEISQQQELAEESVEIYRKWQALAVRSHTLGRATEDAVAKAAAKRVQAEENLQLIKEARKSAENAIEVLLGRHPSMALSAGATLPVIREAIPRGMTPELLYRRPDIIRAQRQLSQAFGQGDTVRVASLPGIKLSKTAGWPTADLKSLVNRGKVFWQPGTQLLEPGYTTINKEQLQATGRFARTVYDVFKEVRGALLGDRLLAVQEQKVEAAKDRAQQSLRSARGLYNAGRSDLSGVLQQQELAVKSEMLLVRSGGQRLLQRINLHLALGGSFQD